MPGNLNEKLGKNWVSLQSRKQHPTALSVCELVSACNV